ncbi:type II toxin-antitoxin system death-on-curing family toxin [Aquabacterium sp.]|uniref:type II toxin-antitoxin system death-on-curing family toxin n=1 Tax=Aquabacterium sp. TaxID=1872578 RepID=UPI002C1C0D39|nr:type II toxin-antitoxin system death-on-curing family toxin [Aquabacterium sp.]HSW09103.1 type II toxin-antitoxin system death-on-curing family toxin [Aquabacterium sp.]
MVANRDWIWIDPAVILAVHDEQLAEHGGAAGLRDAGLLESALARPRNLAQYGEPDVAALAASYAFGLARNHPFVDGNKRSAFVATELFLHLNGWQLDASDADCVLVMLSLAAGDIDEPTFTAWLRERIAKR